MISYYKTVDGHMQQTEAYEKGCWINVCAPDENELRYLTEQHDIPPEYLRSALDEEESSHLETEDGRTLIIVDAPYAEKAEDSITYSTMPIGIMLTERDLVTVSLKDNPAVLEMADGVVKNANTALRTQFVLYLLLRIATRFLQYLKQIDKRSSFTETELRKSMRNKELIQLLDLEKSLVYFQTSLKSNEITMEKMMRSRSIKLYEEDEDLLEDVLVEIKQAIEMTNIYLSILSGTMDAFASVISNNLNIVMKMLASITIVMAIPTMIFSFFGMNIGEAAGGLPLAWNVWIPLAIALVATVVTGIVLYKKDMF
ncbi:MAG TPA: magnesium transporter CorA family protein [Firmicutes bacterium]|nr:magnesium transporter CorA family protein [Bacillota bacterium]